MDYRQFRQWSPPTTRGHRVVAGLSKAEEKGPPGISIGPTIGEPIKTPKPSVFASPVKEKPNFSMPSVKGPPKSTSNQDQQTLPGVAAHETKLQEHASKVKQGSGAQLAFPGTGAQHGPAQPGTFPKKPKEQSSAPKTPASSPTSPPPAGGTPASGKPGEQGQTLKGAGPNVLGWYHFGQAMGMAAGQPTGGAQTTRLVAGRAVAGAHGLLNRKTPGHYEADRAQREAQLQRQQQFRRMSGEGGGVVTQSSMARGLPVYGGIRRLNNAS